MAQLDPNAVDKLIELLTLPVGGENDRRPESLAGAIQNVSEEIGWLVFEDATWYQFYRPDDIQSILTPWFDDDSAAELATKSAYVESNPDLVTSWEELLTWCEQLVANWKSGEMGLPSDGESEDAATLLGIPNPHYERNKIHGTQFYKYVDDEYLYAANADAAPEEWQTLEEWYERSWRAAGASTPDGTVMGWPNPTSILRGTDFYRQLADETYVYAPTQYAEPDAWRPYEYWADMAAEDAAENELLDEVKSFLDRLDEVLGQ
jgi:hypothetical protein